MSKIICPNCNKYVEKSENCELCSSGLILNERYYLLKKLGQNIGVTYQAFDEKTENNVVIKELSIKKIKSWKDEELFKRESDTLMSLDHKQIPKFVDYFEVKNGKKIKYYTIMELIEGETLSKVSENTYFDEYKVISLIKEVSVILTYLHNLTPIVIHRDIKPSNLIKRKSDGKYVLIDFDSVINSLKPGGDSTIAGTLGYMAPEQFMGKANYKSDYYSLGVIALELLTNKKVTEFMKGTKLDWVNARACEKISKRMRMILTVLLEEKVEDRAGSLDELGNILSIKEKVEGLDIYKRLHNKLINDGVIRFKKIKDIYPYMITNVFAFAFIFIFMKNQTSIPLYLLSLSLILFFFLTSKSDQRKSSEKTLFDIFLTLKEEEVAALELLLKRNSKKHYLSGNYYEKICRERIKEKSFDEKLFKKYKEVYQNNELLNKSLEERNL